MFKGSTYFRVVGLPLLRHAPLCEAFAVSGRDSEYHGRRTGNHRSFKVINTHL